MAQIPSAIPFVLRHKCHLSSAMPGLHLWLWQNDEWLLSTFLPPCCPDGSDTLKLAKTLESGRGWTEGQQTSAAKGSGTALTAALLPQVGIRISINAAAFYTFSGCSDGQLSNCQCLSGLQTNRSFQSMKRSAWMLGLVREGLWGNWSSCPTTKSFF